MNKDDQEELTNMVRQILDVGKVVWLEIEQDVTEGPPTENGCRSYAPNPFYKKVTVTFLVPKINLNWREKEK